MILTPGTAGSFVMPVLVVLFATTSFVNLREAQSLRLDRTHRIPQFSAGQLPTLMETQYQSVGNANKVRLASLLAPILVVYFVKANDCIAIIPEVEDVQAKYGTALDIAIFAIDFSVEEREQLRRLFPNKQLVLECGECKDLEKMRLPKTPHRLLIERTSKTLLLEERPGINKIEREAFLIRLERLMIMRGHRAPNS